MNIEITDKEVKLLNSMILSYWIENNNTHEDNCEDWISTENLVKKLSQHDVSGELPKYAKNGDYCAVCGGDEFWNDEEE